MVPITVTHLFDKIDQLLISCLKSCTIEDWNRPTLAKKWTVKDIAAHLLDGNFRTLSMGRDQYFGENPPPIESYSDLVNWLNALNADWVNAYRRVSPSLLISLLELTAPSVRAYYQQLDPHATAMFPVAWAGEDSSANWFHLAREYTEKWHHQAQIREAIGRMEPLLTQELFHPFLQTMVRGLPHQYRHLPAASGTTIQLTITGEAGGSWFLQKSSDEKAYGWKLTDQKPDNPETILELEASTAWKLFTKGIRPEELIKSNPESIKISGDYELAKPALNMIAVMA